jgi:hypothetical protein
MENSCETVTVSEKMKAAGKNKKKCTKNTELKNYGEC